MSISEKQGTFSSGTPPPDQIAKSASPEEANAT